ncbi:MAG: YlxR family protein [Actinomycetota bacterium]
MSKIGLRGRTCVGCRSVRPKAALIRLVLADGRIVVDSSEQAPGRGAYVCPSLDCFERGRRRIAGALRAAGANQASLGEEFARAVADR